jgi:hypothetical protein
MIGITNRDSSFLTIESPDVQVKDSDLSIYFESFSITEKSSAMPQGSLTFHDQNHLISKILRIGAKIKFSWGYKDFGTSLKSLLPIDLNFDEITGPLVRRGMEGVVTSPSGGGDQNGKITYNCNFTGIGFKGIDTTKEFSSGKKRDVINKVFDDIGVSSTFRFINFSRGGENVTPTQSVRQDESSFLFLTKLAKEWRALFMLSYLPDGGIGGIFIEPGETDQNPFVKWMFSSSGNSHYLDYGGSVSNVISYTCTNLQGESGVGDNVQLEIVNGEIVFRKYIVEEQKVTTYRLNQDKVQDIYSDQSQDVITKTRIMQDYLSTKSFDQVKQFFDPVESSTAPQGYGFNVKAKMMGNPLFSPPSYIKIGAGFPEQIGNSQTTWYLESVTHNIDQSGYQMNIEVVDAFALSKVGLVIQ